MSQDGRDTQANPVSEDGRKPEIKHMEGGRTFNEAHRLEELAPVQSALRPEQAEALLSISALLNRDLNPGRVLYGLISQIKALFHADRVGVFLRQNLMADNEGGLKLDLGPIVCAASLGLSDEYLAAIIAFYENKEFRHLQNLRRPVYIANAQADARLNGLRSLNKQEGFQSVLTLPLLNRENLIGVLDLYHDQARVYSSDEIRLLAIFANQAALSITNARLYEESRRRELDSTRLSEAGRIFNSSLKLREVLHNIALASMKILGNSVMIFIVQDGTVTATPILWDSEIEAPGTIKKVSPLRTTHPIQPGEGAVGKTLQSGVPFFLTERRDILKATAFTRPDEEVNSLVCVPLKAYGKTIGVLASYQITYGSDEVEPLEKRHMALATQLADRAAIAIQNARLYEAEKREQRAKDEFLSLISHELRTPLTSIKGYNHLLYKRLDIITPLEPEEQFKVMDGLRHYTEVIGTQIDRLQSLVEELTSISHIETGKLELKITNIELVSIVQDQIERMEQEFKLARQPRIRHQFELKAVPQIIQANVDPMALSRVVRNLLSNAVKFSPKGGVVRVRVQRGSDETYITVQDEGIGMPLDVQERIFERFYKVNSHPNRANGLGLGLYISKHLIEGMGGRIKVESSEGVGSTFTISLPHIPANPKIET
ncbi:MAG: ATP-binding protein [Chloroflexota bacterium]|nr:GAF domain-containing protein [Chloroflexota bacterium]